MNKPGFSNIADIASKLLRFWGGDQSLGNVLAFQGEGRQPTAAPSPAAGGVQNPMTADLDVGGFEIIGSPTTPPTKGGKAVVKGGTPVGAASADGGDVEITGGDSTNNGQGGEVLINGAPGGPALGDGGDVVAQGGAAANGGNGGDMDLRGGTSSLKTGGFAHLDGGNSLDAATGFGGGEARIRGGGGTLGPGGNASVEAGGSVSGADGLVLLKVAGIILSEVNSTGGVDETSMRIFDVTAGTLKRISRGAVDTGGVGFRALRIPN